MTDQAHRTFGSDFKRFFLRGLGVLLPTVLTLWLLVYAWRFLDNTIAAPINAGIRLSMNQTARFWEPLQTVFDPPASAITAEIASVQAAGRTPPTEEAVRLTLRQKRIDEWWAERWYMNLIGLVTAITMVYMAGRLLGGYLGRRIYGRVEQFFTSVPVIKQVYPYVKQIVDFLVSEEPKIKASRVVAVEYPRTGIWSIGLVTGERSSPLAAANRDTVTLFIPSSPTPFTGYTITVPRNEVRELPLTIDQALRFVVSGGVLVPGDRREEIPDDGGEPPSGLMPIEGVADEPAPASGRPADGG